MGVMKLLGGSLAKRAMVVDVSLRGDMTGVRRRRRIFELGPYTGSLREGSVGREEFTVVLAVRVALEEGTRLELNSTWRIIVTTRDAQRRHLHFDGGRGCQIRYYFTGQCHRTRQSSVVNAKQPKAGGGRRGEVERYDLAPSRF